MKNRYNDMGWVKKSKMETKKAFDGIILDIDGTIWNTTEIVADAWNKAIKRSGFDAKKVNSETLKSEFGKPMNIIASDLWGNLGDEQQENLMRLCCEEEQSSIRANERNITYPGVLETVKELSFSERFYIVSNCQNGYIELMLEKTGLTPFIQDFECFGRTGKAKAENILILKARNRLRNAVYIGDTQGDADACLQAGIPFIWAAYGFGKADRFFDKLDSFSDLKRVLGK